MDPIIKIKNLSVTYGEDTGAEVRALENINLEILSGEFVIIFGPSGCGKSTLLYAISGAERRIASGELWIKNQNLRDMRGEELTAFHRRSVGMVFQAHNLINTVNIFENITLPLVFRGVSRTERNEIGKKLLEDFGLSSFSEKLPNLLSGGQQQRVGICRALVNDTDIILADEPTGNLDSQAAIKSMDTFADINLKRNKTIVLVTHEAQYLPYASKIVHMKDGRITGEITQKRRRLNESSHGGEKKEIETTLVNVDKIVSYYGLNFGEDETSRFKKIIKDFTNKKIDNLVLKRLIDQPFKKGGLGLHTRVAEKITMEIRKIFDILDGEGKNAESEVGKDIGGKVYQWLFSDYAGRLSKKQEEIIADEINKRMNNKIGQSEFLEILDRPTKEGGAGLNWHTARNITQKIDLLF